MTRIHSLFGTTLLLLSIVLGMADAAAQSQESMLSNNVISAATLSGSVGRIAVNTAAGNGSAQANLAAIGTGGSLAAAAIENRQRTALSYLPTHTSAQSEIGADAFRGASGLISVNQSSGNGNTQANLAAIAVGNLSEVSTEQLGRVNASSTDPRPVTGNGGNERKQKVAIADSAFAGAHGVVQVNQLAGSGNSTANVFALTIGAGIQ
jgi:hypothetical protein